MSLSQHFTTEHWIQRITFAAETKAARRTVAAGRTHRHTHTDAERHNNFSAH